ncbi:MAG: FMN-binding protein [Clostridia bacterium]|jgi:uncharacterized protein with FMN-binding domain|nr:MAG: FMN-binding protein [Clostridia bacterium]
MKYRAFLLVILSCLLLLNGCGNTNTYNISESGNWKDGTYTETAKGKKGNFEVSVTIKDGTISDISVGENQETPDKGGVVIDTLPGQMLEKQTYDVDAISGATVTSDALKDAVARCLEQASNE